MAQEDGFQRHGPDGTVAAVPTTADGDKLPIKMLNDRLLVKLPTRGRRAAVVAAAS